MAESLRELRVLAIDCQAAGATPAHGDLLELGWATCAAVAANAPVRSHWVLPRSERPIPRAVRELTGWREADLEHALPEADAWAALLKDVGQIRPGAAQPVVPVVIHYARFELPFLRDLHERLAPGGEFPFDPVCLHAVSARLFPELPRRNIRALAGYLGHSPELVRRCAGHVDATVFIWRALVPQLEQAGIDSWQALQSWLQRPLVSARRKQRRFPLEAEQRRALPCSPGVYRFVRRSGDVLYVGKATSLRARVASHFRARGPASERVLELLTQVHRIDATATATLLEAALLESDEIKRLDPPYNVQLRTGDRQAWFATADLSSSSATPEDAYPTGPLPSQHALMPMHALIALAQVVVAEPRLRAMALCVPTAMLPDDAMFGEAWASFARDHLEAAQVSARRRVTAASRALWLARGRSEPEVSDEEPSTLWDLARVRRRLERSLVQCGLLMRRARFLCLLADAAVAFQERDSPARALVVSHGQVEAWHDLPSVAALDTLPTRRPAGWRERQRAFDASVYDRLRVLLTELRRIQSEGGEVALRIGTHMFDSRRAASLMRTL